MHTTHDLPGRLFFHTLRLRPTSPIHHVATTTEVDPPYRVCPAVHIFRLPLTGRAVAIGRWDAEALHDEDAALLRALMARPDSPLDASGHIEPAYEHHLRP